VTDLTKDSVVRHLAGAALPIAMSLLAQAVYQFVDLYFVSRIGTASIAGFNAAGNVAFLVAGILQVLNVGTMALVAHAAGRKDLAAANAVFNQSVALSFVAGILVIISVHALLCSYMGKVTHDASTIQAGTAYLYWMSPGLAFSIPVAVFSAALRGVGITRAPMTIYLVIIVIKVLLAPVLIAGWITGSALGVRGAGLTTTISMVLGMVFMWKCVERTDSWLQIAPHLMYPRLIQWRRILWTGLPAGAEFALVFLSAALVYYVIRDFGNSAQAGFGIGTRLLQITMWPAMSVALAAVPVIGQNFGAMDTKRIRKAFRVTLLTSTAVMLCMMIFTQSRMT
jgi:putative MATE family efflux protein